MTPEGKVKAKVKEILKEYNAYFFMPVANMFSKAGIPDIIACLDSVFIGIECKAGKNKCTKLQELELHKIGEAGGKTLVINENNVYKLRELLECIKRQNS